MKKLTLLTLLILTTHLVSAQIINIPADYPSIQEGINAASDGDTVLVDPGTYVEHIYFNGKNITVASHYILNPDTNYIAQTIIDADSTHGSVATFKNGEDSLAVLCGFTLTGGDYYQGGGIHCKNASPTLKNLKIKDNVARRGGGVFFENSTALVTETEIINNTAINYPDGSTNPSAYGGGVRCYYADPVFIDVNVSNNVVSAPGGSAFGGGFNCWASSPVLKNVKIEKNVAVHRNFSVGYGSGGGGIRIDESEIYLSNVTITENQAGVGGGIAGGSGIEFDSINRCNIYLNKAIEGNDLYGGIAVVIVDTFTVLNPTSFHSTGATFNIKTGYLKQEAADLYVSPLGNNTNSGLSEDEPLLNTWCARSKIIVDSLNMHTIHLLEGAYSQSINDELFPMVLRDYISLTGESKENVILDAEGNSGVIVLSMVENISLIDLTITGGVSAFGGGIRSDFSKVLLQNLIITDNTANNWEYLGGGIYCNASFLEINNTMISGNSAEKGGGIYIKGSNPVVLNTTFENNLSKFGGGLYCADSSLPQLIQSTIRNNKAEKGGGLYNNQSQPIFDNIYRSSIYLNQAIEGNDLYSDTLVQVVLDTFTVLMPTKFHAEELQRFSFDILNGIIEQVDADLYVSPHGDNSNSGLTSDQPLKTIHYTMSMIIPDSLDQNTIHLLNGNYSTSENDECYPINLIDNVNLSGESQNGVILNAEQQSGVMIIQNNSSNHIERLTISGGKALNGCGIYINYSNPTIQNVSIINNNNDDFLGEKAGGGIYCSYSNPTLKNLSILNNSSRTGGGIYCFYSNPVIQDVVISDNHASGYNGFGGGIYCFQSDPYLENVTISENISDDGGGIYCDGSDPVIHNTDILGNIANGYDENGGGGIFCIGSSPELQNVNIMNNIADAPLSKGGGGICSIDSYPSLTEVTISGNLSVRGGGVYLLNSLAEIQNATISNNSSSDGGGGLYCDASSPELTNVRIDSNYSKRKGGGGMYLVSNSVPVLKNVSVVNNSTAGSSLNKGGGLYVENSSPVFEDVLISDNYSYSGGGIYCITNSISSLKNVSIINNNAWVGGGVYNASSSLLFDDSDRCNIYLNNAVQANDLYSNVLLDVVLDTFSVKFPTDFHAEPVSNFSFDIAYGLLEQVNGDLYVSPEGDNTNTGLTENEPVKNIRIAQSKILVDSLNPRTIHLLTGTYSASSNDEFFPLTSYQYLNHEGEDESNVILDAEGKDNVIYLENLKDIEFRQMTITGGSEGIARSGGGVSCHYSDPSFYHVTIKNNIASYYPGFGGGIYCYSSNPFLKHVTIADNTAESGGGGIYCDKSSPVLYGAVVKNNIAEDDISEGGGLLGINGSDFICRNTVFSGNSANRGGAIHFDGSNPIFENVLITDNTAWFIGGGISCYSNSAPVFSNVEVSFNEAERAGGIAFSGYDCNNSLINVSIVNNSADEYGGGLSISPTSQTTLLNSIVWNNSPSEIYGDSILVSFSDIRGGWPGEGNIDADPFFTDLPDFPFSLSDQSPCINTGTLDTSGLNLPDLDLAGNPRFWDSRIDMGAYEWNSLSIDDDEMENTGVNINCYPNPFTTSTTISFDSANSNQIEICIYNQMGELIQSKHVVHQPGKQSFTWEASGLPSGIYFIRMQVGNDLITRKMIKLN